MLDKILSNKTDEEIIRPEAGTPTTEELTAAKGKLNASLETIFEGNIPQIITQTLNEAPEQKIIGSKVYISDSYYQWTRYPGVSDKARCVVNLETDIAEIGSVVVDITNRLERSDRSPQVYMSIEQKDSFKGTLGVEQYMDDVVEGSTYWDSPLYFMVDWNKEGKISGLQLPSYIIDKFKNRESKDEPRPVTVELGGRSIDGGDEVYSEDDIRKMFFLMCEDIKQKYHVDFEKMFASASSGNVDAVMTLPEKSENADGFSALLSSEFLL